MWTRENIVETLRSHYGVADLLEYSESDGEVRFKVPTRLRDPQTEALRSRAPALNELAVSHRLSLAVGRGKCGIPEDSAFAIKSIETWTGHTGSAAGYSVSLSFETETSRRGDVTALTSTLVTGSDAEVRTTVTAFNVMPASLVGFVRRSRKFLDYADVGMSRDASDLESVGDDRFRYHPSEGDRISDGRRVDHVPALTLVDLGLLVGGIGRGAVAGPDISADFLNYTDPRLAFDIVVKSGEGAVEFVQNNELVAIVRIRDRA